MMLTQLRRQGQCGGFDLKQAAGAIGLTLVCGAAGAQATGGSGFRATASADALFTYNDSHGAGVTEGSDFIAELRPTLAVSSASGRIRGSLNYALGLIRHSNATVGSQVQHTLSSAFTAEAVPNFAYVDATANVSRTALSAYGQQFVDSSLAVNGNRSEVANLSISPYVRGRFGDVATYEARVSGAATNTRDSITGDSTNTSESLNLSSVKAGTVLGWSLQLSRNRSHFRAGGNTDDDRAIAGLTARPDPELQLSLRGGQETTDVLGDGRLRYANYGGTVQWTPNERTSATVAGDERYFGRSYSVALQHRFPRSSLSYTATRDATYSANPTGVGQPQTLYQLFFNQFASVQPDPVLRDQLVIDYLRSLGQDPNALVNGGFVNSGVTLQRRQDLAWTYTGLRANFTLQAFASDSQLLGSQPQVLGTSSARQAGLTSSIGYRLTPTSSLGLTGSLLKTLSTSGLDGNTLKSVLLNWTNQLGKRTTASLSASYSVFDSTTAPYRQTSIIGSVSERF